MQTLAASETEKLSEALQRLKADPAGIATELDKMSGNHLAVAAAISEDTKKCRVCGEKLEQILSIHSIYRNGNPGDGAVGDEVLLIFCRLHLAGSCVSCWNGRRLSARGLCCMTRKRNRSPRERILVVADALTATQEIGFRRPFARLIEAGEVTLEMVAPAMTCGRSRLATLFGGRQSPASFSCRVSPRRHRRRFTTWPGTIRCPSFFTSTTTWLDVPENLGPQKFAFYNERRGKGRSGQRSMPAICCTPRRTCCAR